jgi:alkanesulfonate monooxygenase SsuD/methylene tetrahydromethanopterin reductase-like flavin-dependent oxidoreductase (luciferase family)
MQRDLARGPKGEVAPGRAPRQIRRVLNLQGVIGEGRTPREGRLPVGHLRGEPFVGPPEWWAERLNAFAEDGFDTLVFWPVDPSPAQVQRFAGEVVPLLSNFIPDRGGTSR